MNRFFCAAVALSLTLLCSSGLADTSTPPPQIVGTWSLALDAGPFGLPGFWLTGIATFHRDGTFMFVDGGDFGGLGTLDTNQIGVWRYSGDGIVGRSLFLSADPATGSPTHWTRATFRLQRGDGPNHFIGFFNAAVLNCDPVTGIPPALTCPDPVVEGDSFVAIPPFDALIQFHRLQAP